MLERTQWEREHSVELDRVDTLERHIELHQRLQRVASREVERSLERDLGLEL